MHDTIKGKVISKCKNDKPWKNQIGKVPAPLFYEDLPLHHTYTLFF